MRADSHPHQRKTSLLLTWGSGAASFSPPWEGGRAHSLMLPFRVMEGGSGLPSARQGPSTTGPAVASTPRVWLHLKQWGEHSHSGVALFKKLLS